MDIVRSFNFGVTEHLNRRNIQPKELKVIVSPNHVEIIRSFMCEDRDEDLGAFKQERYHNQYTYRGHYIDLGIHRHDDWNDECINLPWTVGVNGNYMDFKTKEEALELYEVLKSALLKEDFYKNYN